jgi:CRISPR system Cascade subunit CasE
MIRMELDRARLFELARARKFPLHRVDVGYTAHCALRAAFSDAAPQPFSLDRARSRQLVVLGYAGHQAEALKERAKEIADPLAYAVFDSERIVSKPMPDRWLNGRELSFEVRACPVIRKASTGDRHRAGAEVDVFLSRCWETQRLNPPDREATYIEWLAAQLARGGGAELISARVMRFKLENLSRRSTGEHRAWTFQSRPDVLFRGVLRVAEPEAFRDLLARGVGRHRAFAFGMLLLRP